MINKKLILKIISLSLLVGAFNLSTPSKAQSDWEWIPPANDYCSGIKVLREFKPAADEDGKQVVIMVCNCGPGYC